VDLRRVRKTLYELVQAEQSQKTMRERLNNFNASKQPPRAPSEFSSLQAFLDFYRRKREYEGELKGIEAKLNYAKNVYDRTTRELVDILPENTPLHFTYKDRRQDPDGTEFVIVNRRLGPSRGQITISSSRPPVEGRKPWSGTSAPRGRRAPLVAALVGRLALARWGTRRGRD
jgi:hypothetical protein